MKLNYSNDANAIVGRRKKRIRNMFFFFSFPNLEQIHLSTTLINKLVKTVLDSWMQYLEPADG